MKWHEIRNKNVRKKTEDFFEHKKWKNISLNAANTFALGYLQTMGALFCYFILEFLLWTI